MLLAQGHAFRVIGMIVGTCCAARAISALFWLFFATAYTSPAKNPTLTADTDPTVTGSSKKSIPDAAIGNLFRAPTMLRGHEMSVRVHDGI